MERLICQGQVIYESSTVETSNIQDSTPPRDEESENSSYIEANDEDNVEGGDKDIMGEADKEDDKITED